MNNTEIANISDIDAVDFLGICGDPFLEMGLREDAQIGANPEKESSSNFEKLIGLVKFFDIKPEIVEKIFEDIEFINSSSTFLDSPFIKLIEHCNYLMMEFADSDSKYLESVASKYFGIKSPQSGDKETVAFKKHLLSLQSESRMDKILVDLQCNILEALYTCFYERELMYRDDYFRRERAEKNKDAQLH